jgi:hypothetical protein
VFFTSQGVRDNTTNALWSFILQKANERAPLDLIPIIHDQLVGPEGTSFSPAEAAIALQAVNLKYGEDERPPRVFRAHKEGAVDEETRCRNDDQPNKIRCRFYGVGKGHSTGLSKHPIGESARSRLDTC